MHSQSKKWGAYHIYIDGFAGGGVNISRTTKDFVLGSPLSVLRVQPPFKEYHFIDFDQQKTEQLRDNVGRRADVFIHQGDCNNVLLTEVFPKISANRKMRGLCLLDPYGLDYCWETVQQAGSTKRIDLFLNFPIMDANRNALWRNPERLPDDRIIRMTRFWGDATWRDIAFTEEETLFETRTKKTVSDDFIAEAYRKRLKDKAGFAHVPKPIPMRNRRGGTIYYLFFASQKPVAEEIVIYIFDKYRYKGVQR